MPTKQTIHFIEATEPIREPITKFGGQPVWVGEPQWPLSRETGNPMRFIAQIRLSDVPELTTTATMAYLFMTEEADDTWEPDGGENGVILQPGQTSLPTSALSEGPTLYRMVQRSGLELLQEEAIEFAVDLTTGDDHEFISEDESWEMTDEQRQLTVLKFGENKLGGTPVFLQGDEFPFEEGSQLLLQLDSTGVPFWINFGDSGVGYAFLNDDGTEAKFLWQCC